MVKTTTPARPTRRAVLGLVLGAMVSYLAMALLVASITGSSTVSMVVTNMYAVTIMFVIRRRTTDAISAPKSRSRALPVLFWCQIMIALTAAWITGQALATWVMSNNKSTAYDSVTATEGPHSVWSVIIILLVLAPLGEEALMRGVVYAQLRRHWSVATAMVVSSLLFALLHSNTEQIVLTLPLGLVLAALYEVTSHLWTVVVAHMLFNMASVLVPRSVVIEISFSLTLVCTVVTLVSIVSVLSLRDDKDSVL